MANIDLNILPNEAINQKNDTTKHVAWARGDSTTRTFKIIDDAGAAVNVSGYTQIKMTVNSLFDPADNSTQQFEIIGDLTNGASGLVTFTPTTTQTNILADTYFYDIQAEDDSTPSVISTLIKSKVHIIQDISKTVSGVSTPDAGVITLLIGDSIDNGATNSIKVGGGGDLKIYHQGDHSYIAESGSGNLRLQANDLLLEDVSSNKFLKGSAGGTVQIWHNAAGHPAAKLTTSAAGVEINGTVTADSYIIDDGTFKTTIVENASSDITLTLPSSTGTLATLADVQAEDTLAEMNDVNLTSPTDGSFLQYDNASSKWIDTQAIVQTANGVNVTGTVTADGLDIDGNASIAGAITDVTNLTASATISAQTINVNTINAVGFFSTGIVRGGSLDINGNADISENLVLGGDLNVTGNVDGQDVADIGSKATTAHGWGNHASAGYLTSFTEANDLSAAVTWANVPDTNITQSSVTQHQAALSITKSQVTDFGTYATAAQGALADSALQSIPSTITASLTHNIQTGNETMSGHVGEKTINTATTGSPVYEFPDVLLGDKGKTWLVVNAGSVDISCTTSGGTGFYKLISGVAPVSSSTVTVAKGGVAEFLVTDADKIFVFGSGLA